MNVGTKSSCVSLHIVAVVLTEWHHPRMYYHRVRSRDQDLKSFRTAALPSSPHQDEIAGNHVLSAQPGFWHTLNAKIGQESSHASIL
jgi:hypothetical protein